MRLPIILALIVVITLPKDVRGFVDDVSAQARMVTASIVRVLDRDDAVQVADASNVLKAKPARNTLGNLR